MTKLNISSNRLIFKVENPDTDKTKETPNVSSNNSTNEQQKNVRLKPKSQKEATLQNIDISKLDMRVGKIVKCEKHPNSESLYVEQIDIGEPILRNVCSGLVKYIPVDQLQDKLVVLLCNLKATKFKGINSEAMVLCASNTEKVEILDPPPNSQVGEKIVVDGYSGEPAKEINKKNKIFEIIKADLKTNDNCIATYKGKPLEVIGKGVVTCLTLKNTQIQ